MHHSLNNRVAIIGAGIAGATCARLLCDAGFEVEVFDKSRGVGGRMSTRRSEWTDCDGLVHTAHFDHGVPGFSAYSPDFIDFVKQAHEKGVVACWRPRMFSDQDHINPETELWVATPNMSAWCRDLLSDSKVTFACNIHSIKRSASGWTLQCAEETIIKTFDAVIIAIPPLQAAALLKPHRPDWADHAQTLVQQPHWILMAVTNEGSPALNWELYRPASGPLSLIIRNDAKPQRQQTAGLINWVIHASHEWSQQHLESSKAYVEATLKASFSDTLGYPLNWHHVSVHRWRYASDLVAKDTLCPELHLWQPELGLGVCGDAWGRGGVEGAWSSANALAARLIKPDEL